MGSWKIMPIFFAPDGAPLALRQRGHFGTQKTHSTAYAGVLGPKAHQGHRGQRFAATGFTNQTGGFAGL
jgi:hypothetical protein